MKSENYIIVIFIFAGQSILILKSHYEFTTIIVSLAYFKNCKTFLGRKFDKSAIISQLLIIFIAKLAICFAAQHGGKQLIPLLFHRLIEI